jgi:hypothetical protein
MLSSPSKNFLKHATASPDFVGNAQIPDGSGLQTFTMRFATQKILVAPAGFTTIIVATPTVPAAYYTATYAPDVNGNMPASTLLVPVDYIQCETLFPEYYQASPTTCVNSRQVTSGRVVSRASELVCATNPLKQDGAIISYKTPLQLVNSPAEGKSPGVLEDTKLAMTGARSLAPDAATSGSYMQFVREGAYSTVFNRTGGAGEFPFHPIYDNVGEGVTLEAPYQTDGLTMDEYLFKSAPCFMDNNFDTMVYKILAGATENQSFIIKSWISIEFSTVYGSFLHTLSTYPPARDERAFRLYGEIEQNLPVAVPAKDNPNFWETMLGIIKPVSGLLSALPGVGGTIAKGVHAFTTVFDKPKTGANNPTFPRSVAATNKLRREEAAVARPQLLRLRGPTNPEPKRKNRRRNRRQN